MTPDRIKTALFGIATRRAVLDYLKFVAVVLMILLAVAWTIDLADNFAAIRKDATADDIPILRILLPYLSYRAADIIVRMLPTACFFGVFLAEIFRRSRLETVIFATSGGSPIRALAAVLIFGVIVGALQFRLEDRWRPAAVSAQVAQGQGGYARRFKSRWLRDHVWFLSGDTAIRAQVLRSDPPALRDVLIFSGLQAPRLRSIRAAERAEPTGEAFLWLLRGVETWDAASGNSQSRLVDDQTARLDLIPEQLIYYGIPGFYLPNEPLRKLAGLGFAADTAADAWVAIWRRRTAWILPGTLALLGVVFAHSGFSGRQIRIPRLIALAVVGYLLVVSIKVFWTVGELGVMTPALSVIVPILVMLAIGAGFLFRRL